MTLECDPPNLNVILANGAKQQSILSAKAKAAHADSDESTTLDTKRLSKHQKTTQKKKVDCPPNNLAPVSSPSPPLAITSTQVSNPPPGNIFSHCPDLPGRPTENCAADHPFFKKNKSLVYSFLVVNSLTLTEEGELVKGKLQCATCTAQSPSSGVFGIDHSNFGGSTGRFLKHFSTQHGHWWDEVVGIDHQNGVPQRGRAVAPTSVTQTRLETHPM